MIAYVKFCENWQEYNRLIGEGGYKELDVMSEYVLLYPKYRSPRPLSPLVPPDYVTEFNEASEILDRSPKASAAMTRRLLQCLLEEVAMVSPSSLYDEIEEVLNKGNLPSHTADPLHDVRTIGNFAAHPLKSTASGTVVDVLPGEADANLDALEDLFDFYIVAPAKAAQRRTATNQKSSTIGKKPIP